MNFRDIKLKVDINNLRLCINLPRRGSPAVSTSKSLETIVSRQDILSRGIYNAGNLARETGRERMTWKLVKKTTGEKRGGSDEAIRQRGKKEGIFPAVRRL